MRDEPQNAKQLPDTPETPDLIRIAASNPTVNACLTIWRTGGVTLERALILMAVNLAEQNERLMRLAVRRVIESPVSAFVSPGPELPQPIIVTTHPAPGGEYQVTDRGFVWWKPKEEPIHAR